MTTSRASTAKSGPELQGISAAALHWNLAAAVLIEHAVRRGEGFLADNGALTAKTGQFTGRSPKDKFIVREPSSQDKVWWGPVNQPIDPARFDALYARMRAYMQSSEVYVLDCFAGASPKHRFPVRIVTELAWHNLFCRQLFIRPEDNRPHADPPQLTIIDLPSFHADPEVDGTRSETFVIVHLAKRLVLIGGTSYAGEMKKSVFSVLNFLLPLARVMPMHCSANVGSGGDVALFFGLSGTGKTTLSADPARGLIGDDEHGWDDDGIFNFEGGCYAKCINLRQEYEPHIWNAIRFGAMLENVVVDPETRRLDYDDGSLTENTRAAYPVTFIENAVVPGVGGHAANVVFLTCDVFGVLPPIARLEPAQTQYHFLSGYTSKVAGTERGLGADPQATFSTCFGAPFLVLHPTSYATLLAEKIAKHGSACWLVNTGWTGGSYGVGRRIDLPVTRAIIRAALSGQLAGVPMQKDPVFGFQVPTSCPGVSGALLTPRKSWKDPAAFDARAKELAALFAKNFAQFSDVSADVRAAGPAA